MIEIGDVPRRRQNVRIQKPVRQATSSIRASETKRASRGIIIERICANSLHDHHHKLTVHLDRRGPRWPMVVSLQAGRCLQYDSAENKLPRLMQEYLKIKIWAIISITQLDDYDYDINIAGDSTQLPDLALASGSLPAHRRLIMVESPQHIVRFVWLALCPNSDCPLLPLLLACRLPSFLHLPPSTDLYTLSSLSFP